MRERTGAVTTFRTLGDEELSEVTGGCHGRRRRRRERGEDGRGGHEDGGSGDPGGIGALLQLLLQSNMAAIFQFVIGDGNTVTADVTQANLAP